MLSFFVLMISSSQSEFLGGTSDALVVFTSDDAPGVGFNAEAGAFTQSLFDTSTWRSFVWLISTPLAV